MGQGQVGKHHIVTGELGALVAALPSSEGDEVAVGNHGALGGASGARCVGEGNAVLRANLELGRLVVEQLLLANCGELLVEDEFDS